MLQAATHSHCQIQSQVCGTLTICRNTHSTFLFGHNGNESTRGFQDEDDVKSILNVSHRDDCTHGLLVFQPQTGGWWYKLPAFGENTTKLSSVIPLVITVHGDFPMNGWTSRPKHASFLFQLWIQGCAVGPGRILSPRTIAG